MTIANTTFARFRHLICYIQIRGFRQTIAAIIESYGIAYRRWYVFYKPIALPATSKSDDGITFRIATIEDVDSLAVFEPYCRLSEFRHYLENNVWVFLALDGNQPVAYNVVSRRSPTRPPLSWIKLENNQLFGMDIYTLPEHRKREAARRLMAHRNRLLREWGYDETISTVREKNLPSLRLLSKPTARVVQRLTYLRFLWFSRTWVEADARQALETRLRQAGGPSGR